LQSGFGALEIEPETGAAGADEGASSPSDPELSSLPADVQPELRRISTLLANPNLRFWIGLALVILVLILLQVWLLF
jgi:tetrahydromethanopterin S-methyltransferase subunit B